MVTRPFERVRTDFEGQGNIDLNPSSEVHAEPRISLLFGCVRRRSFPEPIYKGFTVSERLVVTTTLAFAESMVDDVPGPILVLFKRMRLCRTRWVYHAFRLASFHFRKLIVLIE